METSRCDDAPLERRRQGRSTSSVAHSYRSGTRLPPGAGRARFGVPRHAGAYRTTHRTTAYSHDLAIRNGTYALGSLYTQIAGSERVEERSPPDVMCAAITRPARQSRRSVRAGQASSVACDLDDRDRVAIGVEHDGLATCNRRLARSAQPTRLARLEREYCFDVRHGHGHDAVTTVVRVAEDVQPAAFCGLPRDFLSCATTSGRRAKKRSHQACAALKSLTATSVKRTLTSIRSKCPYCAQSAAVMPSA
jgi:hypothetical protein